MRRRDGRIELLRFIASVFIAIGHMGFMGYNVSRPFANTWYYVEMFFMLTGYFTMRHVDVRREELKKRGYVRAAMEYTCRKFTRYLPYTIPALLVLYLYRGLPYLRKSWYSGFLHSLENLPFEAAFLSAANTDGTLLIPIWFLSAIFIVLPLFFLLAESENKYLTILVCLYASCFYYLYRYDFGSHAYPNQMIRAFCGMSAGVLVYYASEALKKKGFPLSGRSV